MCTVIIFHLHLFCYAVQLLRYSKTSGVEMTDGSTRIHENNEANWGRVSEVSEGVLTTILTLIIVSVSFLIEGVRDVSI